MKDNIREMDKWNENKFNELVAKYGELTYEFFDGEDSYDLSYTKGEFEKFANRVVKQGKEYLLTDDCLRVNKFLVTEVNDALKFAEKDMVQRDLIKMQVLLKKIQEREE